MIGLLFGHKQAKSIVINDAFGLEIQLNPEDQVKFFHFISSHHQNLKIAKSQTRNVQTGSGSECR